MEREIIDYNPRYIELRVLRSKTPTLKNNRMFSAPSATRYGEYRVLTYFQHRQDTG